MLSMIAIAIVAGVLYKLVAIRGGIPKYCISSTNWSYNVEKVMPAISNFNDNFNLQLIERLSLEMVFGKNLTYLKFRTVFRPMSTLFLNSR